MTLEEAFTGSECIYKSWDKHPQTFKFNELELGKIGIRDAIHYDEKIYGGFSIVKIIPTEQAKKWLMENFEDAIKQFDRSI